MKQKYFKHYNIFIFLFPDGWNKTANSYKKLDYGKWELHLPPNADGSCPIKHLSEVKIIVKDHNNELLERLSPWATYVTQNRAESVTYKQRIWHPSSENVYIYIHKYVYNYFIQLEIYIIFN